MKAKYKLNLALLCAVFFSFHFISFGQKYKEMMADNAINFYDVVQEAEAYFKTINAKAKGSGYKNFMRWANNNEHKYYPTGNRMNVNPAFATEAFNKYLKSNNTITNKSNRVGGWRELGPFVVENITGHYAAGMGRIEDLYVDPNNDQKIYIGSRSGGFWSTLDEGNTWSKSGTEILPASGVNSIAVNPANTNHVYIALRNASNGYSYGIYESLDAGVTFSETAFNPTNLGFGGLGSDFRIYSIVHHPTIAGVLFIGTSEGLYKVTGNFTNWTSIIPQGNFTQIKFHPTNSTIVYAVNHINDGGSQERDFVYISNNTGDTFSTTLIPGNNNSRGLIDVTENEPDAVFFASSSGIWKSVNQASSFASVGASTFGTDGFAVNDTNSQNLIIGALNIANSTNGGANFVKRTDWSLYDFSNGSGTLEDNYFNSNSYVHADLRVAKSINGVFYVGTDGFLAKSSNGGVNWENLMQSASPAVRENYKLGISQSNNKVVICGSQDNGTTIKNETEWVEAYGADGMEGLILPLNPNYMIGSYQFGGRIRTLDAGVSNSIVDSNATDGWWEAPLLYDPNDHFKIYDFRNGVYVSTDFGLNYNYVGTPNFLAANPGNYWSQIRNAEIAQNNTNIIVVTKGGDIEKSINGGVSFFDIQGALPNHDIEDIAFNPNNDDDFIIVNAAYQNNSQKVYRTTDGGTTWSNITYNLGDIPVHSVVVDNTSNPNIYIGTEVGVYYKPLNGTNWLLYNTDLPYVAVQELEINYGANTIKAVTWGRGLWEYDLVGRENYPSIETTIISNAPTLNTPKIGVPQFVTSTINYGGVLSTVEVKYSVDNLLFDNTISMSNSSGNIWVSDQALPDVAVGAKVYFKVIATGSSADISETYKFMYEQRDFVYCNSQGISGTGADYIDQVTLDSFVNNSGQSTYTLYDNLSPIVLNTGTTYQLTSRLSNAFLEDVAAAWIDFNNNAEFEPSEAITMSNYVANVSTGSFTVPNDAVLNETIRLRVSNIYNNNTDPCGTFFGEVEDYLVTIDSNLSVEDFNGQDSAISIYPNPSNGDVFVNSENNNITKIELFDIRGRKVIQQNNLDTKQTTFNIEHLQESVYILNVYSAKKKTTKKIIKVY
ncbi:GEVED domain-containing protein [uncultured Lacinutrix sp.]|uniref:GEVED domain-containing protein n=1 Tax=uncultured Lacinutrix sp. TaxID=574032 RepID=UPI002616FA01|nr:GEVED domain-containing protein [uncultured Lacinutrix sp.]